MSFSRLSLRQRSTFPLHKGATRTRPGTIIATVSISALASQPSLTALTIFISLLQFTPASSHMDEIMSDDEGGYHPRFASGGDITLLAKDGTQFRFKLETLC